MTFRGEDDRELLRRLHRPPGVRRRARDLARPDPAYIDEELDRVELVYNRYVSPLTQYVRRQTLLPLQEAEVFGEGIPEPEEPADAELAEAHAEGALGSTSPTPRSCCRSCSRSTWTSRSSGRCSSRPRRSTARG